MNKRAILMLIVGCSVFSGSPGFAGQISGAVTGFGIDVSSGRSIALVYVSGTYSGQPTCATQGNQMAINLDANRGYALLDSFMRAYAIGAQVTIIGNNTCQTSASREDVVANAIGSLGG